MKEQEQKLTELLMELVADRDRLEKELVKQQQQIADLQEWRRDWSRIQGVVEQNSQSVKEMIDLWPRLKAVALRNEDFEGQIKEMWRVVGHHLHVEHESE